MKKSMQTLMRPFNSDSAIEELVKKITKEKDFSFDVVIETGTYYGYTTKWFATTFPEVQVYTIEKDIKIYSIATMVLKDLSNVRCYLGDSKEIIKTILEKNKNKKILFYLDAHWHDDWPILDELDIISNFSKDNCCILIDDLQVPNRQFEFDRYDGQELNLEYIQEKISKIFDKPFFFFPEKSNRHPRPVGKIVCFPDSWKHSLDLKFEDGYYYY